MYISLGLTVFWNYFVKVFIGGGRDCDLSIFDSRQKKVQAITNRVLPYRHVEYVHFPGKCPELRRKSSLGAQHRSILIKKQVWSYQKIR